MSQTDLLVDYMIKLNEDTNLREQHESNPAVSAMAFGLNEADVKLVVDQDHEAIDKRCSSIHINPRFLVTFHSA